MPADPGRDDFGLGVGHGQGADQVDQLRRLAPGLAVLGGAGASDLDHLGSCRKVHPPGGLNRLDGAPHPPPVRGVDARDGWDFLPGQGLERLAQGLLVALDRQHVVTTATADPLSDACLGVHGVSGYHGPVQVEGLKQVPQSRDLWLDLSATRCWVSTALVAWSKAARRCGAGSSLVRAARA